MSEPVYTALKKLSERIHTAIDEGIANGSLKPETVICQDFIIDEYKSTEFGVKFGHGHSEDTIKRNWSTAIHIIFSQIWKTQEYLDAIKAVEQLNLTSAYAIIKRFISHITNKAFDGLEAGNFSKEELDRIVTQFYDELCGASFKYIATVELQGISIKPEKVELDEGIILRQPRLEDIQLYAKEILWPSYHREEPESILTIEISSSIKEGIIDLNPIRKKLGLKIRRAINILRLFKVWSVHDSFIRITSDAIISTCNDRASSIFPEATYEKDVLTEEDRPRLLRFWKRITKVIPECFYDDTSSVITPSCVAYQRYCDALFQKGGFESRVAYTMMGLEALFLESQTELGYRLQMRISKLMAILGKDPRSIKKLISKGYKIRSAFVHGNQMSTELKKEIEEKYGSIRNFLHELLESLRISIIIMISIKGGKDEIINLIDDAMIEKEKEEELSNLLSDVKELVESGNRCLRSQSSQ